jgi:hypothetical protein
MLRAVVVSTRMSGAYLLVGARRIINLLAGYPRCASRRNSSHAKLLVPLIQVHNLIV